MSKSYNIGDKVKVINLKDHSESKRFSNKERFPIGSCGYISGIAYGEKEEFVEISISGKTCWYSLDEICLASIFDKSTDSTLKVYDILNKFLSNYTYIQIICDGRLLFEGYAVDLYDIDKNNETLPLLITGISVNSGTLVLYCTDSADSM